MQTTDNNTPQGNSCIVIAGPTAVGKTSLAIQIAQHFSTDIISADSRQCYTELGVGVAKPSPEQLSAVHHYFINSHSIHDEVSVGKYETYALASAEKIFSKHNIAVMVGGTGLYIKAFCEGMDAIPAIDASVREDIIQQYEAHGLLWLQQQLQQLDPAYFSSGEIQNPQRAMRALEVVIGTGQSIRSFQTQEKKQRPFNVIKIGLELPREELYHNINTRVDIMMDEGLLEEAKDLLPYQQLNALQTVGYTELFDHLNGHISLDKAIELIKRNTRHYAKRQMTWFRRDASVNWFHPTSATEVVSFLHAQLS